MGGEWSDVAGGIIDGFGGAAYHARPFPHQTIGLTGLLSFHPKIQYHHSHTIDNYVLLGEKAIINGKFGFPLSNVPDEA